MEEKKIKTWQDFEDEQQRIKQALQDYTDRRSLELGDMKCPETKEWIDILYCNSFAKGTGCRYKDSCIIYRLLSERR